MRGRGITFDTGLFPARDVPSTHEPFDANLVAREMRVIRDELHCNVVRATGSDLDRLEIAAGAAGEAGLAAWYSPFTVDVGTGEMLDYLDDAAERCERLRRDGVDVVLTLGAEMSVWNHGFLPGETFRDRIPDLNPLNLEYVELLQRAPALLDAFFAEAVPRVRERFGGPIGYASLPFEQIDWSPFDYASVDLYPNVVDGRYVGAREAVRRIAAHGKPVAITEFGCPACQGAARRAGRVQDVVVWDWPSQIATELREELVRDEGEQARYVTGLLDLFEAEQVDTAFVFTFASRNMPQRAEPRRDADLASYSLVRVLESGHGDAYEGMPWEPKEAFHAVAQRYGEAQRG